MKRSILAYLIRCLLIPVFIFISPNVSAEGGNRNVVGNIDGLQGKPHLIRGDRRITVDHNTPVQTGDRLVTPKGSRLSLRFNDNTRVNLGETTQFEIKRYQFDQKAGTSDAQFKLLKGAFRAITGAIGKQKNPKFEVETSVATIGIRGTDFLAGFIFSENLDVAMISGKGVYILNTQGQVEIDQAGQGTTVKADQIPASVKIWPKEKLEKALAATALK